jgi:hypothetical protein
MSNTNGSQPAASGLQPGGVPGSVHPSFWDADVRTRGTGVGAEVVKKSLSLATVPGGAHFSAATPPTGQNMTF